MVVESKTRFAVSFGLRMAEELAAAQTLPVSSRLGPQIEWRLSNAEGGFKPYAAIVRHILGSAGGAEDPAAAEEPVETVEDAGDQAAGDAAAIAPAAPQVLVVTRLGVGGTCHVAYVDAAANDDADALAREAADALALDFDCGTDVAKPFGPFEAWGS
jgi:hypothetical protein